MGFKVVIAGVTLFASLSVFADHLKETLIFEDRVQLMHGACSGNTPAAGHSITLVGKELLSATLSTDLIVSMAYNASDSNYADSVLSRPASRRLAKQYIDELMAAKLPCAKAIRLLTRYESIGKGLINLHYTGLSTQIEKIENFIPESKFLELYASCKPEFKADKNYINSGDSELAYRYFSSAVGRELAVSEEQVRDLAETVGRTLIHQLEPLDCATIDRLDYRVTNAVRLIDDMVRANIMKAGFTVK